MGKMKKATLRVDFDRSLKQESRGFRVTSDAWLLAHQRDYAAHGGRTIASVGFQPPGRLRRYERLSVDPTVWHRGAMDQSKKARMP